MHVTPVSTPLEERNYTDVIVTGSEDAAAMAAKMTAQARSATQVAASRPNDPALLPHLLDELICDLVRSGAGPASALAGAGRIVRDTPWANYRSGRARLATMAATYLRWFAPSGTWTPGTPIETDNRIGHSWFHEGRLFVDVLEVTDSEHDTCRTLAALPEVSAVRQVRLSAPTRSLLHTAGRHQALRDTDLWFEEQR